MNHKRTKPRVRSAERAIHIRLKRDQRRQQQELLERYLSRPVYPQPEERGSYRP